MTQPGSGPCLIWPLHKKVCGPGKANPFTWPDLTEEEGEAAKKHLRTPVVIDPEDGCTVSIEEILRKRGVEDTSLEDLIDSLVDGHPCSLPSPQKQHHILFVRSVEYRRLPHEEMEDILTLANLFRSLSHIAINSELDEILLASPNKPLPPWYSYLHHLLVAVHGLCLADAREGSSEPSLNGVVHLSGAHERFIDFVKQEVQPHDAGAAKAVLEVMERRSPRNAKAPSPSEYDVEETFEVDGHEVKCVRYHDEAVAAQYR
ncbi:hypothetical protein JCM8097_007698 [Rhodosporidiobolus ruineniae]